MHKHSLTKHLSELRNRLIVVIFYFSVLFILSYYYKAQIFYFLLKPLTTIISKKIIYTGLAEAFISYLKLAAFSAIALTFPIISYQLYRFISPGLYYNEKVVAKFILLLSPILFWLGCFFVYYFIMPKAWIFFLNFEVLNSRLPLILEARMSEYINLTISLMFGFGIAFQLPIILTILNLLNIITPKDLRKKRRLAVIMNFIIAGILTPPDILSQFALAIPLIILYEISIIINQVVFNKKHKINIRDPY